MEEEQQEAELKKHVRGLVEKQQEGDIDSTGGKQQWRSLQIGEKLHGENQQEMQREKSELS